MEHSLGPFILDYLLYLHGHNCNTMKLEKILERLNSLEKGPFVKIINGLIALQNKTTVIDSLLAQTDGNLKNADSIQLSSIFNCVSKGYGEFLTEEYGKVSSQLDILFEILTRDGNCIMRYDWFSRLYEEQIKKQKKAIDDFKRSVNAEKPLIPVERLRDFRVYKTCLHCAYHNDEGNNLVPKITPDEQSILNVLAKELELSQDEITMIKYSVLGISLLPIETLVSDLRDKGVIFVSRKTNTIYVADEIVTIIRQIHGKEIADKYFRRVLLQLKESQINQLCRKHSLDYSLPLPVKIENLITLGISLSSVLKEELYKADSGLLERRKFVTELCDEKLAINPTIRGASLDEKVTNLIKYFNSLSNDDKLGISAGGYERLLLDLKQELPTANADLKKAFQLQEESVMYGEYLSDYNIMPRDVLELFPREQLSVFCENHNIKPRGNLVENILTAYRDTEALYIENYESIGRRDLSALKENGILLKEADLGLVFEDVTRSLFSKLGFIVDEDLRKKLNTEKDKMDILLRVGDDEVVLIECKTSKDSGYNKFSSISRQIKSYKSLLEKNNITVVKMLVVAPDFSEDFVADCSDDFDLNVSLMKASSLSAIYHASKECEGKKMTVQMLMKDVLIQEDRIIRALKR